MMKALNVKKSSTVVCYDTGKGFFASRAAFVLKSFGHPNVYVLDGHFSKWVSEGRATESDGNDERYDAEFDYTFEGAASILSYDRIKEVSQDGSIQIVDSRPNPSFQNGNIASSISVPSPSLLAEDGTIKSSDQIREKFESEGVDTSKPMVFTCGGGVMVTQAYCAAVKANFAGPLYIYDGSWAEFNSKKS